jgi:hypothetical protein
VVCCPDDVVGEVAQLYVLVHARLRQHLERLVLVAGMSTRFDADVGSMWRVPSNPPLCALAVPGRPDGTHIRDGCVLRFGSGARWLSSPQTPGL